MTPSPEFYVCPRDHSATCADEGGLVCTSCRATFPLVRGVVDFDIMKAPDREVFDERFRGTDSMSESERTRSLALSDRFARALGLSIRPKARVLDVACGNGALTYGLLAGRVLSDSDVFCFDHSVESMRVLLNTAGQASATNKLHASIQDVHRLAYPAEFFDVVFGNAVLHHFVDYEHVLGEVRRILKPGATAIFAEPVGYGYLWATFLMHLAAEGARHDEGAGQAIRRRVASAWGPVSKRLARLTRRSRSARPDSGRGLLDFFVKDTMFRLERHGDKQALATLTDKHYFLFDDMANLAARLGFRVQFAPYEPPGYYDGFMRDMLTTYGVEDPAIAARALALFGELREFLPTSVHRVASHFQFIVLTKEGG